MELSVKQLIEKILSEVIKAAEHPHTECFMRLGKALASQGSGVLGYDTCAGVQTQRLQVAS